MSSKLELISFKLCPFVQRSVVTLNEKNVPYDISYIELDNKPDWFLKLSPLGKVPVLKVDGQVLFESQVINEYLDEVYEPKLHPAQPLARAVDRAWIEFSGGLNRLLYFISRAETEQAFQELQAKIVDALAQVEAVIHQGPFFHGEHFHLIDGVYAPVFMRLDLLAQKCPFAGLAELKKIAAWQTALLARDSVKNSVVSDFAKRYYQYLAKHSLYLESII